MSDEDLWDVVIGTRGGDAESRGDVIIVKKTEVEARQAFAEATVHADRAQLRRNGVAVQTWEATS